MSWSPTRPIAFRVAALYGLLAGLWIVLSDSVVALFGEGRFALAQTGKGLLFVAVTTVLLYVIVDRMTRSLLRAQLSERRHAEHLETVLAELPAFIFKVDRDARVLSAAGSLLPYATSQKDLVGRPLADVLTEDEQPGALPAVRRALDGEEARYECHHDGHVFDVNVIPVSDGAVGVGVDVTVPRREQEERAALEERVRESERIEAVGRLAGGIAHDFNNMLLAIRGYAELLVARTKDDDGVVRYAHEIVAAAERATGLTRQLLAFGRRQVLAPEVFDLNDLPAGIASMLERVVGDIYTVEIESGERAPVHADKSQLEQAVVNLVLNARDAMPDGGRIAVRTGAVALDQDEARRLALEPAAYAMICVSDHGTGMDPDTLHHVFEPFFSTKDATRGTGLGLSTVHGVATQSGGAVGVQTEAGRGSTFTIFLPLAPTGA